MQPPAANPVPPYGPSPSPGSYPARPAAYPSPYGPGAPSPYGPGAPSPYGYGYPPSYPPRGTGLPRPTAVAPVAGTPFAVALVEVRSAPNGPAAGSLVAGIASILVSTMSGLFAARFGAPSGGAFALLAALLCAAAVGLARIGLRRIRPALAGASTGGRGVAIAGQVCGLAGLALAALVVVVAFAFA